MNIKNQNEIEPTQEHVPYLYWAHKSEGWSNRARSNAQHYHMGRLHIPGSHLDDLVITTFSGTIF
jgi:hypothetical protein